MLKIILLMALSLTAQARDYPAVVKSVYDGDTMTVTIDLGLKTKVEKTLRLSGIDTPEMRGNDKVRGKEVRDYVRGLVLGKKVTVRTMKDKTGKYGRLLAVVMIEVDGGIVSLNEMLIKKGMAVEYGKVNNKEGGK